MSVPSFQSVICRVIFLMPNASASVSLFVFGNGSLSLLRRPEARISCGEKLLNLLNQT